MRANQILQSLFNKYLVFVHRIRLEAVFFAVEALLYGGRLSLTGIARSAVCRVVQKHTIKRIDRLLGNPHLHGELPLFFKALSRVILRTECRPVILIDWTNVDKRFNALSAAIPFRGRALPIYWEVHPKGTHNNRRVLGRFLQNLQKRLPASCHPIVVTDGGFRNTWFERLRKMGWDWVGRLGNIRIREPGTDTWKDIRKYYPRAKEKAEDLGLCAVAQTRPRKYRVILGARWVRNVTRPKAPRHRGHQTAGARKTIKRSMQPWVLATSLQDRSAQEISSIYSKRMSIEELYRDTKNYRFGWSFRAARARTAERYEVLLLIATLGMLCLIMIGLAGEQERRHLAYQNNTVRHRRVLSLFFLGKQMLLRARWEPVHAASLWRALKAIQWESKQPVL